MASYFRKILSWWYSWITDEEKITVPSKKRKLDEDEERAAKRKVEELENKEEIPTEEYDYSQRHPSALEKLKINLDQGYQIYKTYREGSIYQYTNLQYRILDPEYILEFTDAIRRPNGQMYEYKVYFTKSMTVLQYRQERKQHEDALIESVYAIPKTFLAFFKKWKKHAESHDIRKYMFN